MGVLWRMRLFESAYCADKKGLPRQMATTLRGGISFFFASTITEVKQTVTMREILTFVSEHPYNRLLRALHHTHVEAPLEAIEDLMGISGH